ncbi:MAG: nitrilase [Gammaproteobacteria bacterium]|nr:nitrilase [Gammaproteobacteria bacterium]
MTELFYAAACQTDFEAPTDRDQIEKNTARMCQMIEQTITGYEPFFDVRLLTFPEFSHAVPVYATAAELKRRLALPIPNEHTDKYAALARKYGCYIQTGSFLESTSKYPDALFNTTLLIGPEGILSRYRKINTWIPWEVHTSPHDVPDYQEEMFPVVDTELGRIGVAICYDWLFPETIRQIAFNGAEIIVRVSAYMNPWGTAEPMNWWGLVNQTRALENTAYVVASNQGASLQNYPPFCWPGGSMVVDYDGRILAQADPGPGERVVVAPVNISQLRAERERRTGHDMRAHLRSGAHSYMRQEFLPPAGETQVTAQNLSNRIATARNNVDTFTRRTSRR